MSSDSISPRVAVAVGLLALAPVAWYGIAVNQSAGIFSAINVVLTIAALAVAMRPLRDSGHSSASA